jgi:hypothetical protein
LLGSLARWFLIVLFAAIGLVILFIAWWLLVFLALGLVLTIWIRRLLGKPPLFQATFRRGAHFSASGMEAGQGGVEPPAQGAVVIEGEYVVEGEAGQKERPRLEDGERKQP